MLDFILSCPGALLQLNSMVQLLQKPSSSIQNIKRGTKKRAASPNEALGSFLDPFPPSFCLPLSQRGWGLSFAQTNPAGSTSPLLTHSRFEGELYFNKQVAKPPELPPPNTKCKRSRETAAQNSPRKASSSPEAAGIKGSEPHPGVTLLLLQGEGSQLTCTRALITSMGLVSVEAVAAASGPEMACRRRWGQSLGVRLESCSEDRRENKDSERSSCLSVPLLHVLI